MNIARFSVKNPVFANLLLLLILVVGSVTYYHMPKEIFPIIPLDRIHIITIYQDVAPEEIEKTVSIPIENAIQGIDGIKEILSTSLEGQSFIETHPNTEMGFWAAQLMYYGYVYEGITIPRMTVEYVEMIVTRLFPQKISLFSAEEAEDAIPELVAFWQFLKREYKQSNADRH